MIRKETVLLYNIEEEKEKKIKKVLLLLGMKAKTVTAEQYQEKLGVLSGMMTRAQVKGQVPAVQPEQLSPLEQTVPFTDEMLVMCGFSKNRVEQFLAELKKKHIETINLKAVLTPYNALWNSYELHRELEKEHRAMNPGEKGEMR